ncbi:M61 family metallopeptidase [Arcticibacter tournemirensis]
MISSFNGLIAQPGISFQISFTEPQAHYADVEMQISGNKSDFIDLKMPVWAPGSYLVREFAKNVEGFYAKGADNAPLKVQKLDKNTWRIATKGKEGIKAGYRVYAFEISVRTSFIDESHAFLSPTGIFMYVDGLINQPATVSINPHVDWKKISTGLDPVKGKKNTFYAENFDVLYDSPIEVGNQDVFEFEAAGVKHEVAMYGGGNYDKEKLSADMALIIETETDIFKENPNKRYVFIVHNFQNGGGGLEHLNSTVLGASRLGYKSEKSYKGFLGLVAHEYFHLWNVKRLRPQALGPFDYDTENYTTDLWIAEGFTAYYDNLMLRRAEFYSPEKYLEVLCEDIKVVENQPGSKIQPVSESSFDAWIKYYRPNENSKNSTISYYNKGALLGMILDLEILNATKAAKGLDDVMKAMYDEYYIRQKRGYTGDEFKAMAEKIAGISLDNFYRDYVHGTSPLNYNVHLGHAGLNLVNENAGSNVPSLGITASQKEGKLIVSSVTRGGSAWIGGLSVNDEIIAVDGYRVNGTTDALRTTDLDKIIASGKVGDKISVIISRDGLLKTIELTLTPDTNGKFRIEADKNATAEQLAVRKKWLKL